MNEPQPTPDEVAMEKALGDLSLSEPAIDRDELMYQAGWAAAAAELAAPRPTKPAPVASWLWPATSGVMTITSVVLACALFFDWQNPSAQPLVAEESRNGTVDEPVTSNSASHQEQTVDAPDADPPDEPTPPTEKRRGYLATLFAGRGASSADNYLSLRSHALTTALVPRLPDYTLPSDSSPRSVDFSPVDPPTARGMLKELLPRPEKPKAKESTPSQPPVGNTTADKETLA